MIRTDEGFKLIPELYSVPSEFVSAEYSEPGTQNRIALGHCPFLWAQSLYIVGKLLQEVAQIISISTIARGSDKYCFHFQCRAFWPLANWIP